MAASKDRAYDAAAEAKRLLRTVRAGALATLASANEPFASLVSVATMPDGSPILLLSRLAAHTGHLEARNRCSILLAQGGKGDPLAHPRLTLAGEARLVADDRRSAVKKRFLARHPKAGLYANFSDFNFWAVSVAAVHLNGGFARAASFAWADVATDTAGCAALLDGEDGALAHMNADHKEAVRLYATRLAGLPEGEWRLSGLDPEGMDLICGDRTGRVLFPSRVSTMGGLRETLAALASEARLAPAS